MEFNVNKILMEDKLVLFKMFIIIFCWIFIDFVLNFIFVEELFILIIWILVGRLG